MAKNTETPELLPGIEGRQAVKKPVQWRFVTNQKNLLYMLAAGLIMSPAGFREKYYSDTLSSFPGLIPLFSNTVPQAALDMSAKERNYLITCVMSIDLKSLRGRITTFNIRGDAREILFPDELTGSETLLLVPAPLPIAWIDSIIFQSKEHMMHCEDDARDFLNVPIKDFKRKVDALLFSKASHQPWPPAITNLPDFDIAPAKAFAAGGIMAMLFHTGNYGDLASSMCKSGFDPDTGCASLITEPMFNELGVRLSKDADVTAGRLLPELLRGIVDNIAQCHSKANVLNPMDAVLEYLETKEKTGHNETAKVIQGLKVDLKKLTGFSGATNTELFEKYHDPLFRAMIIFFLREKSSDLIEFRHPMLTEADYVIAAVLFGTRDGWIGLPLALRDITGLQEAVSHRMAVMAHRSADSGMDLIEPPPGPMPLRELFMPEDNKRTEKQKKAALLLARELKWSECLSTCITLGKGEYSMVIEGGNVHIILPGVTRAVDTKVDFEKFLDLLGKTIVPPGTDEKVRSSLNG